MTRVRLTVVAGCLLAGCSAASNQAPAAKASIPPPSATGTSACFYPRQVQSFRALDRSNLIVYALNGANAYHVRITPPAGLEFAESLTFLPADARICGYAGERLIIGIGPAAESRAVIAVSRLTPDSLAALRASSAGEPLPVARPQPGTGAVVEGPSGQEGTEKAAGQSSGKLDSPVER